MIDTFANHNTNLNINNYMNHNENILFPSDKKPVKIIVKEYFTGFKSLQEKLLNLMIIDAKILETGATSLDKIDAKML